MNGLVTKRDKRHSEKKLSYPNARHHACRISRFVKKDHV